MSYSAVNVNTNITGTYVNDKENLMLFLEPEKLKVKCYEFPNNFFIIEEDLMKLILESIKTNSKNNSTNDSIYSCYSNNIIFLSKEGIFMRDFAKDQNDIIGVASLRSKNHISLLFVDERYHRTGVGKALLSTLQDSLPKGETEMTVNAAPFAVGFYEKIGFVKSDELKKADGIVFQPMVVNKKIER